MKNAWAEMWGPHYFLIIYLKLIFYKILYNFFKITHGFSYLNISQ